MKGFAKCLMCCIHTCILKWVVCCVPSKVPSAFGYHLPFISPALLSKVLMKFTLFHSGFTVWKYFVAATLSFNLANKKYKGIAEDLAIQPPDYTKWLTVIHLGIVIVTNYIKMQLHSINFLCSTAMFSTSSVSGVHVVHYKSRTQMLGSWVGMS